MDPAYRKAFNAAFDEPLYRRYLDRLQRGMQPYQFRVAETPLFLTHALRDRLVRYALELVSQLSVPATLARLARAVPARFDVPRRDALPNTAQVDFALVRGEDGGLDGRLIELQGFPSLYALMPHMAESWRDTLRPLPGLDEPWSCFVRMSDDEGLRLLGRTILGGCDPSEVVLVDVDPERQKTFPDFEVTRRLFGVDWASVTDLELKGRRLFRVRDGRRVQVRRIYNRMVFDELELKKTPVPFSWTDDLDVSWCSHPNWYWIWSKYALPFLDHPAAPRTRLLSDLTDLPADLSQYVLKPLFSFAGSGVAVDVTREVVERVPRVDRDKWALQEKVEYAPAVTMPEGHGVKAEVRVMLARPPEDPWFTPMLCLVRFARGKMLGVDFNKDMTWVGGGVALWPVDA